MIEIYVIANKALTRNEDKAREMGIQMESPVEVMEVEADIILGRPLNLPPECRYAKWM